MKPSNSCHWLVAIALILFSFNVYSLGGSGTRTLTCGAGWKVETVREGRTYSQKCVVDSETMSRPEYNRESNRVPNSSATAPSAPTVARKPTKKATKALQSKDDSSSNKEHATVPGTDEAITASQPSAVELPSTSDTSDYQKCNASSSDAIFVGGVCKSKESMVDRGCMPPSAFSPEEYTKIWNDIDSGTSNYTNVTKTIIDDQGKSIPMTQFCTKDTADKSKVADGGACEKRFQQALDACFTQSSKASTDCDQENDGIQEAMNATKAVGVGAGASVQLACSKLGEISKIANTSLGAWRSFCAFSQSSCETSCSDAKNMYNDPQCIPDPNRGKYTGNMGTVQENITVCVGYKKQISEAAEHATAALLQMQSAKKCELDSSSLTKANVDECIKNPSNPLCTDAQRCSNATFAASNKVCQCINNPNSKECIANNGLAGSRGVAGATIPGVGSSKDTDPGAAFIPPASGSGTDAFANALQSGAVKNEQNLGGSKGNAGLGGNTGGPGGGGGGAGSGGSAGAAGAAGDDKFKVNSGFYGGATGGGYLGRPGGGAYGSGRLSAGGVNYNKLGAGGAQFDPRRYIAGLNGKSGEYINGPNMDIFRIVKNRIESKKPTMLDPDYKK